MYQSERAGDEAKKRKSPAKSGTVGIYVITTTKRFQLSKLRVIYMEQLKSCPVFFSYAKTNYFSYL